MRNAILAGLSPKDRALLDPHLEKVELPRRRQLEQHGRRVDFVYFPESGVASVVAEAASRRSVEVAMIGREGLTGLAALIGSSRSPYDTFMQVAGRGQRAHADAVCAAFEQSATLRTRIMRYAFAFGVQISSTAVSNARSKIEERLARWLLMVHDRIDENQVRLTHEFLATMLGVRRAGVTIALGHLESLGLIEARRGAIVLVDREGLKRASNGAYGAAEEELQRTAD